MAAVWGIVALAAFCLLLKWLNPARCPECGSKDFVEWEGFGDCNACGKKDQQL